MIAATTRTKIRYTVLSERAHKTVSDAPITDAYRPHGIVTATMIAVMVPTNRQNIASQRAEHVSVICLRAIMAIVFREFISATETMIVWTIVTKTTDINAVSLPEFIHSLRRNNANIDFIHQMTENVTKKRNSHARKINHGAALNVYRENGCVTVIPIVSMEQMRM